MLFRTKQRKDKLSIYPKSKQNAINITEILSDRWRRSTLRLYMSAILRKKNIRSITDRMSLLLVTNENHLN